MNAKTILFIAAIIASGNVLAQQNGRDSVYANPATTLDTTASARISKPAVTGRSSVYANDLPAPSRSTGYAALLQKFGRA